MFTKDFIKKNSMYIVTLLAWACLIIIVPYTADDWAWGTTTGMKRLANNFDDYNGRYLGNVIVIALMHSFVLRIVLMSVFITLIPILIKKITKLRINYGLSLFLLLLMNVHMWCMTIVWISGFANYITSAVFTLMMFVYLFKVIEDDYEKRHKILLGIGFFILGLFNTLIVEHMTLYNIFIALFLLVYIFVKEKKVFFQNIMYLISCIVGASIMFSNSSYTRIANDGDRRRKIAREGVSLFKRMKENYFNKMYKYAFLNNNWLNLLILGLLIILFIRKREIFTSKSKKLLIVYLAYMIWAVMSKTGVGNSYTKKLIYIDGIFAFIGYTALISLLLMLFYKTAYRMHIIFLVTSCIFHNGVMLFIAPISARCFFMSYILWILIVAFMVKYIFEMKLFNERIFVRAKKCLCMGICVFAVFYMCIYGIIHQAYIKRDKDIRRQVAKGNKTITIDCLPFVDYVHGSQWTINSYSKGVYFKEFYNIPKKCKVIQRKKKNKKVS